MIWKPGIPHRPQHHAPRDDLKPGNPVRLAWIPQGSSLKFRALAFCSLNFGALVFNSLKFRALIFEQFIQSTSFFFAVGNSQH